MSSVFTYCEALRSTLCPGRKHTDFLYGSYIQIPFIIYAEKSALTLKNKVSGVGKTAQQARCLLPSLMA